MQTPKPHLFALPLAEFCEALALGVQEERPVMETRAPIPTWTVTAAILQRDGLVLVARRSSHGLLGGMWEFPGGKVEEGRNCLRELQREIREELGVEIRVGQPFGIYRHAYTHLKSCCAFSPWRMANRMHAWQAKSAGCSRGTGRSADGKN